MCKLNPYRVGGGLMPKFLAGREIYINEMSDIFDGLNENIPSNSVMFSGLRGVGKTVLLNKLSEIAEEKGIYCRHIEIEDNKDFIPQITDCMKVFLQKAHTIDKVKSLFESAIDTMKRFQISFCPDDKSFSLSLNDDFIYKSSNLSQSLTDVFTSVGKIAFKLQKPICFFIDEIQYMKQNELGALIAAIHRSNQLGYPIIIVGAGLPKIFQMLSKEKSYSERLFNYREIGKLSYEQSALAIKNPILTSKVQYSQQAVDKIIEVTKGYPYFIQGFCQLVYQESCGDLIEVDDVNRLVGKYLNTLDEGFFRARYERCSSSEKIFLFAMVRCGDLPCTISNVATNMHKTVGKISPTRAQLINKGIIYPVRYKEIDFTVPEFDGFIKRRNEYTQWVDENF